MADPRWAAVQARDPQAVASFVYAVRRTGVYCRPSCGARPPRPENVTFHDTPADAQRSGFRAGRQRVWQALQAVPPRQTAGYAAIAQRIGALARPRAL